MSAAVRLGFAAWLTAVAAAAAPGDAKNDLPPEVRSVLDRAESVELLSLDPGDADPGADDKALFHGYRILGRTPLKEDTRRTVLSALDKGIQESDGKVARCFNPRHGIRATREGKTVDLVICFECLSMRAYFEGRQTAGALTTRSPQPTFDRTLRAAGVPLPEK